MSYNKLTEELLAKGYTADNYPKHMVHIGNSGCPDNPLDNYYGGFEYNRMYAEEIIYQTGCGLYVKGENVLSNVGYMNEEWSHENYNPLIVCPYNKSDCKCNDERLHDCRGWCVCHVAELPYDYENSFEREEELKREEKKRKYQEYLDAHDGRSCRNHMFYNERTKTWSQKYNPERCAENCCSKDGYCPILGKQLSHKRGNVYYDVKTSGIIQQTEEQQSIFDGDRWETIRKGIRYFKKPCSIDICEAFVRVCSNEIDRNYRINHTSEKMINKTWNFEILNIRAESKPSRDLLQDLADIKAGISVSFEPDSEKREKEWKKKKKQEAQKKKIERLEKKIIETGYENLEENSLDRVHADKWLSGERMEELEQIRQQKIKEEQNKPVQLSLFDMI